jgi:hypothetical protein
VNLFDRRACRRPAPGIFSPLQVLSPRTPGDVYRSILLDRLPTSSA